MIRNQPEANSFKLASILGIDSKDPEKVIEFLKTIPTAEIIKAQYKVLTPEVRTFHNFFFILPQRIILMYHFFFNVTIHSHWITLLLTI